ncbi:MAG: AmmeMemoRadiSam system protein B [Candidatus Bathyarchaeia archaeon]
MKVRRPCQAGVFYAGTARALRRQVEGCFLHHLGPGAVPKVEERGPRDLVALVCPHAGYMYSGHVAAHAYHQLAMDGIPESVVILGPNHTGFGSGISLYIEGAWRTPLGDAQIDSELATQIQRSSRFVDIDEGGHRYEHSIEVQLPFLQYLFGDAFKIVPISMMIQDLEVSRDIGEAIAKAAPGRDVLVIASTDLTHYEPMVAANAKDRMVIEAILQMNEEKLHSTVESKSISMCGYGPTSAAIVAAKGLDAKTAQLLCYGTSGDVTGDRSQVVGYASLTMVRR